MSNEIKLTNKPFQNIKAENSNRIAVGATDHSKLSNRDLADQHPISAITGLQEELDSLSQGVIYTPNVSTEGVISWTNNGGLENPTPVNIKGAKGDKGEQGIQGIQGERGLSGVYVGTGDMPADCNVQIDPNGSTEDYVKKTDYATDTKVGVVKVGTIKGIKVTESGEIGLNVPNETAIAERLPANSNLPITIGNLDYAVRSVSPQIIASLPNILEVNTIYDLGLRTTLSIQLPNANYGEFIQVDFYSGETKTNLNIISPLGLANYDLNPEPNTMYSLFFDFGAVYATSTIESLGWRFGYAEYPHKEV